MIFAVVFSFLAILKLLLARLESAYSLIWGAHRIWGQGGGDPLTLLRQIDLFNETVIGENLAFGMG